MNDDPDMEGFEQCEACDGYFDRDDLNNGICADCEADLDEGEW